MFKIKKESKEVPMKNYVIVLIVSVLVIIITLYVRSFYLNYQSINTENSIFEGKSINQLNMDDINYAVSETNEVIMFVSYNGNRTISNMEMRLYKEIEKKNLNDIILYLNVSDKMDTYVSTLRKQFSTCSVDIKTAPMLIYIKDGKCVEVYDSSKELISYKTFNTLLSKYGIE